MLLGNGANQLAASIISTERLRRRTARKVSPPTVIAPRKGNGKSNLLAYIDNDLRQSAGDKSRGALCLKILCGLLPTIEFADPMIFNEAALRIMCNYPVDILKAVTDPGLAYQQSLNGFQVWQS